MLSRLRISAPQCGHRDRGETIDSFFGDAIDDDGQEAPHGETEERGGHGSDQGIHVGGRS